VFGLEHHVIEFGVEAEEEVNRKVMVVLAVVNLTDQVLHVFNQLHFAVQSGFGGSGKHEQPLTSE